MLLTVKKQVPHLLLRTWDNEAATSSCTRRLNYLLHGHTKTVYVRVLKSCATPMSFNINVTYLVRNRLMGNRRGKDERLSGTGSSRVG